MARQYYIAGNWKMNKNKAEALELAKGLVEALKDGEYDKIDDETKYDDDEFLLPEDMIGSIKDIIFKRNLLNVPRETNEVPMDNIVK